MDVYRTPDEEASGYPGSNRHMLHRNLDENTGTLDMTEYYGEEDEGPWYGHNITDVGQVKLIWSSDEDATFYNGQWSDVQGAGVYTNLDTGEEIVQYIFAIFWDIWSSQ